jgi:hypothetical protein
MIGPRIAGLCRFLAAGIWVKSTSLVGAYPPNVDANRLVCDPMFFAKYL